MLCCCARQVFCSRLYQAPPGEYYHASVWHVCFYFQVFPPKDERNGVSCATESIAFWAASTHTHTHTNCRNTVSHFDGIRDFVERRCVHTIAVDAVVQAADCCAIQNAWRHFTNESRDVDLQIVCVCLI